MFTLALLIGIYSYLIFTLGLLDILYKSYIIWTIVVFLMFCIFWYRRSLITFVYIFFKYSSRLRSNNIFIFVLLLILFLQALINLIGALGPELGFDALWYHLTLPKLYLLNHSIFHIPGGILYYSGMPKLTEMIYVGALSIANETVAKFIHFLFGILTCIALYKLSGKFFDKKISLLAVVIFYSNLVVAWQSITAYIDLARTFFEVMALWGFMNWWEKGERKWLVASAIMLGLAVSTKILAIGSLLIFILLITYKWLYRENKSLKFIAHDILLYCFIVILLPLPWFMFSLVHTGNPIYPFFSNIYKVNFDVTLLNPLRFLFDTWNLFARSSDPISPIYIIFLPLVIIFFKKFSPPMKLISLYSLLALIIWYFTPRTGGGRFILPYLPAFSVLSIGMIREIRVIKAQRVVIGAIILFSLFSVIYRFGANLKYLPVILGKESKTQFLSNHLNFSFGDFYDIDGYFRNQIKQKDMVLLYGFHNLYYVDFPFIDSSWVKKGDAFNYIAVQNSTVPRRFSSWNLIYSNPQTRVNLYSIGGQKWAY